MPAAPLQPLGPDNPRSDRVVAGATSWNQTKLGSVKLQQFTSTVLVDREGVVLDMRRVVEGACVPTAQGGCLCRSPGLGGLQLTRNSTSSQR